MPIPFTRSLNRLLNTLCFGLLSISVYGEAYLLKNVSLPDPKNDSASVSVNLLIRDGILVIVSKDPIPSKKYDTSYDVQGGTLLGKMTLDEPANFLILKQDPRENVEIFLDTATHATFAISKGEILRNYLATAAVIEEEEPKRGWLAYSPPPFSLPVNYEDGGKKWNQWTSKYINGYFLAALVMDRQRWLNQDENSLAQYGDLNEYDGGEIRGFRYGTVGTFNFKDPWVYTLFAASNSFSKGFDTETTDDLTIFDYRLDIPMPRQLTLSIGKQKEPISLERMTSMVFLPMQERTAVSDALMPSRNVGAVLSSKNPNQRISWAVGAFNDWFDAGQEFDESASQYIGRFTSMPFVSADGSNVLHSGLGIRYSDAKEGVRYKSEPEFNKAPTFVDTGWIDASSSLTYNAELYYRKARWWLGGEYTLTDVETPTETEYSFSGYHATVSYSLTGEMRSYHRKGGIYDRLPVARSVYENGPGTWEIGARYSDLDLSDEQIDGGDMRIWSIGINWWLSPIFNFNFNYRHTTTDRFGIEGTADGFNTRILLVLE